MTVEFMAEGRIVWGHPGNSQKKKDPRTKEVKLDKQGQPIQQWIFMLAIPKENFNAQVLPYMQQEAMTVFPQGVPANFAWKYKDGDTAIDGKGKPYRDYEGRAGCIILTISTEAFSPPVYKMENGAYVQMQSNEIKCGDFVGVKIKCLFNGATGVNTPGLYINPQGIFHVGYGSEIVTGGENPQDMFGGHNFQIPAGASATPVMSNAPLPGVMGVQAPASPVANLSPAVVSGAVANIPPVMPAPAHDFVNNAGLQQPSPTIPQAVPASTLPQAPQAVAPEGMVGLPQGR